ncbi:MAG: ATP-binding protein [Bacteroidales bacterium]|jgi:predicted AAA+ superfamily ATPase|nr:ATP-binding protein [Bacteroidales bacterium]
MENTIIPRPQYMNRIEPFVGKQLIKVLTGQRRVGKSYILRQLMQDAEAISPTSNIIYINKEDMRFDKIKTAEDLNDYVQKKSKEGVLNRVYIDEIQEIKSFENALRSLLLNPIFDIYCTGSNANILSGELATHLSGRYIEFPINSLSFNEFITFNELTNTRESMMQYIRFGGLPYLKHLQLEDEIVYNYLKGIYNTVLFRDVIMRFDIRNSPFLENLTLFLADNIGQQFSANKISAYLKSQRTAIAASQVIQYIAHLSNAFLIHRVPRFDISGKRLFEIGEKFYFEDIGIRNALTSFKLADIGKIMENVVYHHLQFNEYDLKVGQTGNNEIDFVASKRGELLYIQVCYLLQDEKTIAREFGNLEKISDNYPKIVVSMDDFKGNTYRGIQHYNLLDFLNLTL